MRKTRTAPTVRPKEASRGSGRSVSNPLPKTHVSAGSAKKESSTGKKHATLKIRHEAPEWACVEMQRAGFAEPVHPDWLCRVLEHKEDDLLKKFPNRIIRAVDGLRKLATRFSFDDDYLQERSGDYIRKKLFERFDSQDDAWDVEAYRFALAFDQPTNERLPTIVSRAYRRTCEYARFLRGDASSAESRWQTSERLATKITVALENLAGYRDPQWGRYLTRGGAWKGGTLRETADFLRGRIQGHDLALEMLDSQFVEIDNALKTLSEFTELLRTGTIKSASIRPSKHGIIRATSITDKIDSEIGPGFDLIFSKDKPLRDMIASLDEREFFILRMMEIYVLSTGKIMPYDQSNRKRETDWQDYRNCVTAVSGIFSSDTAKHSRKIYDESWKIVNDLRKLKAKGGFDYLAVLANSVNTSRKMKNYKFDSTICYLMSAEALWLAGLGREPKS